MKPTPAELCQALVIIGSNFRAIDSVRDATFRRLAELGLIRWEPGEWELSRAGIKLLPKLLDGAAVPELI
jgi:hypothetical protein